MGVLFIGELPNFFAAGIVSSVGRAQVDDERVERNAFMHAMQVAAAAAILSPAAGVGSHVDEEVMRDAGE